MSTLKKLVNTDPKNVEIVLPKDKAEPNKSGQSATTYNVITGEIPINNIQSQEDLQKLQSKLQSISEASSINDFKQRCEIYKVNTEKQTIKDPDIFQAELIKRNKNTGKTGILRVDETSPMKILFIESEVIPNAEIPSNEEINNIILHKQVLQIFNKNMNKIKAITPITINEENLNKVLDENKT